MKYIINHQGRMLWQFSLLWIMGVARFFSGETLRKFWKNFLRKLLKMHHFSIFFKKFNKLCVNYSRFWTKHALGNFENIFDENSIEKLNFYIIFIFILENLLLKIEPSEITPLSATFFSVSGGGDFPLSPWLRRCSEWIALSVNLHHSFLQTIFCLDFHISQQHL